MELGSVGCLDLTEEKRRSGEALTASAKIGKFKRMKESGQSPVIALNKFTSQIKKPSYRKSSPLSSRKKGDSYLNRKIKLLQEVGGMNLTLDEALGGSNPHYSKVLREKIAGRQAACKAMEARKAALVEASWCRILQAARIQNKEAQALLLKAEKNAAEVLEAATAKGVIMYDKPNCSQKQYEVETSCVDGGRSTTHTVTASFVTAFEVDKEVASAVKSAFLRDGCNSTNLDCKMPVAVTVLTQYKKWSPGKLKAKLVDTMLERLRCLQEDELSSLATILATCGLSAALADSGNRKMHDPRSTNEYYNAASDGWIRRKEVELELPSLNKFLVKRMSKLEKEVQEAKNTRKYQSSDGVKANKGNNMTSSDAGTDLGSIFAKHSLKLESEIEEARKNSGKAYETIGKKVGRKGVMVSDQTKEDAQELPSLDKLLMKHVLRLEKEVQEVKNRRKTDPTDGCQGYETSGEIGDYALKNEVDETSIVGPKESTTILLPPNASDCKGDSAAQVEENLNTEEKGQFVKQIHRLEREKIAASSGTNNGYITLKTRRGGNVVADCESLDKVLVKNVSKLEKEKMKSRSEEEAVKVNTTQTNMNEEGGLDQILVKHKSRLEKEKMAYSHLKELDDRFSGTADCKCLEVCDDTNVSVDNIDDYDMTDRSASDDDIPDWSSDDDDDDEDPTYWPYDDDEPGEDPPSPPGDGSPAPTTLESMDPEIIRLIAGRLIFEDLYFFRQTHSHFWSATRSLWLHHMLTFAGKLKVIFRMIWSRLPMYTHQYSVIEPQMEDRPGPRLRHTLTCVDGEGGPRLILFGGYFRDKIVTSDAYCYSVRKNRWSRVIPFGKPPTRRSCHAATAIGRMVIIQGGECDGELSDDGLHVLNFTQQRPRWHSVVTQGCGPGQRHSHVIAFVAQRYVICFGGYTAKIHLGRQLDCSIWALDTITIPYEWRRIFPEGNGPAVHCAYATANVNTDGVLYIYAGIPGGVGHMPVGSVHTLTRHGDGRWEWRLVAEGLHAERSFHAAVFVNARLHVSGGFMTSKYASPVSVFDTTSNVWWYSNTTNELMNRSSHSVAAADNCIFTYGGVRKGVQLDDLVMAEDDSVSTRQPSSHNAMPGGLFQKMSIDVIECISEKLSLVDVAILGLSYIGFQRDAEHVFIRRARLLFPKEVDNLYFEIGMRSMGV